MDRVFQIVIAVLVPCLTVLYYVFTAPRKQWIIYLTILLCFVAFGISVYQNFNEIKEHIIIFIFKLFSAFASLFYLQLTLPELGIKLIGDNWLILSFSALVFLCSVMGFALFSVSSNYIMGFIMCLRALYFWNKWPSEKIVDDNKNINENKDYMTKLWTMGVRSFDLTKLKKKYSAIFFIMVLYLAIAF